jgi:hypothetical protein
MKKLKMVYKWILLSILIQCAGLAYINFIYLPGRGAVKATIYEIETAAMKDRKFKLPEEASDIAVSFDGLYVAYRQSDKLIIADIDKRKTIRTLDPAGGVFTCFRWLPDREMLIYSVMEPEGQRGQVLLSTYDIIPELDRSYPVIKSLPKGSEIIDIELSPLTNIVYPIIKTEKTKVKVYKFDIMDNLKYIMSMNESTVFKETMYTDNLIYQTSDGRIRIRNGKTGKLSQIPVKGATVLLATDDDDFIYAAAADENGKLTEIFYGKGGQKADEWQTLKPDQPIPVSDVYVTAGGAIFISDRQEKTAKAIKGIGTANYQGELLTVLDSYTVSVDGDKLLLEVLEK